MVAFAQLSSAQQKPWQPYPFGQVSYYKDTVAVADTHLFYAVSPDSTVVNGNDTVVYLNRKIFPSEPMCLQPGSELWNEPFVTIYDPFVRDSFRVNGDTVWFNGIGGPPYSKGWVFNVPQLQPMNLSGTESFVWDSAWYNVQLQDSVRRITLYASLSPAVLVKKDTMRISKTHGLLTVGIFDQSVSPALANTLRLQLCGYVHATAQWGFHPPPAERYVEYYPGDIMKWHYHSQTTSGAVDQYYRDSVTSVVTDPDFVQVNVWEVKQTFNDGIFTSQTEQATFLDFDMTALRLQAKRTTAFMAVDTTAGSNPRAYQILLYEQNDNTCVDDTVMVRLANAIYYVGGQCQVGILTDDYHAHYFSTKRGLIKSTYAGLVSGETDQVGYYSPTKGISCGDFVPLDVDERHKDQHLTLFPNPATERLTLSLPQPSTGTLQILDAAGRLVLLERFNGSASETVDVTGLAAGLYVVRALSNSAVYTTKFTKQ